MIVLEAALLVEAGWKQHFDCLWVFSVPPPVAQQRVVLRNNVSLDEAARRLASQSPNALRYVMSVMSLLREWSPYFDFNLLTSCC